MTLGAKLGRVLKFRVLGAAGGGCAHRVWCSQVSTQASGTGGLSDLLALVVAWLLFGAGALLARRIPVGLAAAVILAGGAAMEVAAFSGPPHLSDDVFR